jgi:hypothetical protein
MLERAMGTRQAIVVYTSEDEDRTKGEGLSGDLVVRIAEDAARREADGWLIAAYDTTWLTSRGSTGWVGQLHPNDVAITVVYRRG